MSIYHSILRVAVISTILCVGGVHAINLSNVAATLNKNSMAQPVGVAGVALIAGYPGVAITAIETAIIAGGMGKDAPNALIAGFAVANGGLRYVWEKTETGQWVRRYIQFEDKDSDVKSAANAFIKEVVIAGTPLLVAAVIGGIINSCGSSAAPSTKKTQ